MRRGGARDKCSSSGRLGGTRYQGALVLGGGWVAHHLEVEGAARRLEVEGWHIGGR